ncbi:hypothetical protein GF367_02635 [Candidatus Woesearchaeota archaeon]|nr:hypothetical protein [Candidatus Woesearchaeota archaeon]
MATLITCLSTGKGTWRHVSQLIAQEDWDKIFLITNEFGKEKYTNDKPFETIVIDNNKPVEELARDVKQALDGNITDTEVAVNIISGAGNEHMAVLSAILQSGLGIRFVVAGDEQMKTL